MSAVTARPINLWLRVFAPFAVGYYLSYLLRTVNAVIAPELTRELGISAADLGLLTSAYFFAFALAQLAIGIGLDRFGARRVETVLLLFAGAGCLIFAFGHSLGALALGRALIGLGVSACLMAALKSLFQWFPPQRQASMTGSIMTAGGLGALSASLPLEAALPLVGWRGVFVASAVLTAVVIVAVWTVPDKPGEAQSAPLREQMRALGGIFRTRPFWRYGLQMGLITGGNMALQGLWAVPWLINFNGYTRAQAADHLFVMGAATLAGYLFVASFATRLAARGIKPVHLLTAGSVLTLASTLAAVLDAGPTRLVWLGLGLGASTTNLAYSLLAAHFAPQLSGRVSTALNLLAFVGAFGIQWGFGGLVDALTAQQWSPRDAYQGAFAVLLALETASFVWFLIGDRKPPAHPG